MNGGILSARRRAGRLNINNNMRFVHARIITMDGKKRIFDDGFFEFENGKIIAVGDMDSLVEDVKGDSRDLKGAIVMPGLINTHSHVPMVMFRGLADDISLKDWLEKNIWPAEKAMVDENFVRWGARLGMMEMLRTGTVCFADMYFYEQTIAEEIEKVGMRGVVGYSNIDFATVEAENSIKGLKISEKLIEDWKGHDRIKTMVCSHSPYSCSVDLLEKTNALSEKYQVPHMIHLAETSGEASMIEGNFAGESPVMWLEEKGVLNDRVIAAHMVWLDDKDIELVKSRGVKVSHNISSNLKLASGIAPIQKYLENGIVVGLGTDGAASNNMLNMFAEMRLAALVHKGVGHDPLTVSAYDVLSMATIDGARVLGVDDVTGSLEEGKSADFIVLDNNAVSYVPSYNVVSQTVYSSTGTEVKEVYVAGTCLFDSGKFPTIDAEEVFEEVKRLSSKVRGIF